MVQAAGAQEAATTMHCICGTKSKIRDVVSRAATSLKDSGEAVVLGKGVTIQKAISVCEIIKRELVGEDSSIAQLNQQTRIYKKEFH